jgi:hypothetical protein
MKSLFLTVLLSWLLWLNLVLLYYFQLLIENVFSWYRIVLVFIYLPMVDAIAWGTMLMYRMAQNVPGFRLAYVIVIKVSFLILILYTAGVILTAITRGIIKLFTRQKGVNL